MGRPEENEGLKIVENDKGQISTKVLRYNKRTNEYHPHFHLIVDGESVAKLLVNLWLKKHRTADRKRQENRSYILERIFAAELSFEYTGFKL